MTPAKKLLFIFLLFFAALFVSLPNKFSLFGREFTRPNLDFKAGKFELKKNFDLIYGLDLAGGSHLVFEAESSQIAEEKRKTAIEGVRDVIERRVNLFGISEPNVQASSFEGKDRIIVELPGIKDTKEAAKLIGKTAQLVFAEIQGEGENAKLMLADLTGADLKSAKEIFDNTTGKPAVSLEFTQEGGKKFATLTERNVGKQLPIILDSQPLTSPVVQETITQGTAQITGNFTTDEAKKLAIQLNAGALPVPISLVEERTVGATLGAESVSRSIKAGLVGLLMVLVFMVAAYGRLGLVADLGLIIFGVLTLALYKLIPVVLTLPGIAGFLLSVGMAVDSNILIFERFKEERGKRPLADALEVSFGRAWDSIRDANIATLVTTFILANPFDWSFLHTSGPVRGFAITLALGIGISLFTGIVVSRNLLRVFVRENPKFN
ncbi:protein-export membrane protein SecD [Candidatus Woesebacteria bacterium RBG_19FT_COMBO_42_9]|uniref:Protein translocase subunit SecD n=1 Tax=Candidatus Woesebacteria bacterium RBG_16_42_24 TaxID=1802485 RepID=A0A1F7XLX1_9BACT|nr:MAG: protein-export membrane protein SecD [Candidatus Woesebacteria bacterium RBG_16_42_24]OGM16224.1 MAG: protein-export membrane protein SecD [Candidatus Woesebacteria bacterium RBG_19FT_COMBO_42_9]